MKRLVSLSLLGLLVLAFAVPATPQGPGLFVRSDCTTITTPVTGQTWCFDATAQLPKVWNGSAFVQAPATSTLIIRSYLAGLTLSTAGSSTTMTIAAGTAADSTNVDMLTLASSLAKTTAAWAVGTATGGLDTGTIANSTWYHFHLIKRTDTAVVDVLVSLSATAPTMPTNYTERRRIGSGRTDGSGNWTAFNQNGGEFLWSTAILDVDATNPGAAAVTRTLTVPTGVIVNVLINVVQVNTAGAVSPGFYGSALVQSDQAASITAAPLVQVGETFGTGSNKDAGGYLIVQTNTSAQIRTRLAASDGSVILRIATLGWIDPRGREN